MEVIALKHMDQFDTIMKHYASNYRMRSILTSQLVDKGIVSRTDLKTNGYESYTLRLVTNNISFCSTSVKK